MPFGILGVGSAAPDHIVTNHDLEKIVETSDEWIRSRTGISERRFADESTAVSDIAAQAGRRALEFAGLEPADIDLIIVGTFTPDTICPSAACFVMEKIGIPNCPAFDLNAACTGFAYAMSTAHGLLTNGLATRALVIGADCISKFLNMRDRNTCVLFGDGAGAVVLGQVEEGRGILGEFLSADGRMTDRIIVPGGGSAKPASLQTIEANLQYLQMSGNDVFRFAVRILSEALGAAAQRAGVAMDDIDWIIPHQANIRIIEGAIKRLKIPRERFIINIDRYGNTSAGSVPLALDEAVRDGRIKKGDLIGFVAFGAGLTWGSMIIRF